MTGFEIFLAIASFTWLFQHELRTQKLEKAQPKVEASCPVKVVLSTGSAKVEGTVSW